MAFRDRPGGRAGCGAPAAEGLNWRLSERRERGAGRPSVQGRVGGAPAVAAGVPQAVLEGVEGVRAGLRGGAGGPEAAGRGWGWGGGRAGMRRRAATEGTGRSGRAGGARRACAMSSGPAAQDMRTGSGRSVTGRGAHELVTDSGGLPAPRHCACAHHRTITNTADTHCTLRRSPMVRARGGRGNRGQRHGSVQMGRRGVGEGGGCRNSTRAEHPAFPEPSAQGLPAMEWISPRREREQSFSGG